MDARKIVGVISYSSKLGLSNRSDDAYDIFPAAFADNLLLLINFQTEVLYLILLLGIKLAKPCSTCQFPIVCRDC